MLNISAIEDKGSIKEISLDSQYAQENVRLTWKFANVSRLFGNVYADFSLENSSTKWRLTLTTDYIYLERIDMGEKVKANISYSLTSKTISISGAQDSMMFDKGHGPSRIEILKLKKGYLQFENDVFYFNLGMKILGPAITKITRSSDF